MYQWMSCAHRAAEREKDCLLRCLVSTFGIGLACHAAMFFSDISFYDDVVCTYDVGTTHLLGRFTLALLGKITRLPFGGSNYSLPWFNGMMTLLFLALFAWMTVRLLHIRGRWAQVLVCGILVSFPVMASLFAYGFTAPYYMFALPMCGVSAYCLTLRGPAVAAQGKRGVRTRLLLLVIGSVVMALMMGIYQAYLPVLLTLEVMILLRDEVEEAVDVRKETAAPSASAGDMQDADTKTETSSREGEPCAPATTRTTRQWRRWRYALGGTVLGFAGYLILMKISLYLTGKELYSYRGIDSLGTGGSSYLTRILWAYRIFFEPESFEQLRGSSDYLLFMWSMGAVYRVFLVLILALAAVGGYRIFRDGGRRSSGTAGSSGPARETAPGMVRYLILTVLFPLMVNFVFVMTDFDVYSMMLFAQVFVFIYPIMMTQILPGVCVVSTAAGAPRKADDAKPDSKAGGTAAGKTPGTAGKDFLTVSLDANAAGAGRGRMPRPGADEVGRLAVTAARVLSAVLVACSVIFYCRYDNLCYYKAGRMQSAAIAYDEILIARIMAVDGYDASLPVCFVNELEKDTTGWELDEELVGVNITPYTGDELINSYSWVNFMNIHCGYSPRVIENYHQYDNYIEEEDMPSYPAEGSIRVIDGVIVVNF